MSVKMPRIAEKMLWIDYFPLPVARYTALPSVEKSISFHLNLT